MERSNAYKTMAAKRTAQKARKAAPPPVANPNAYSTSNPNYQHNMDLKNAKSDPAAAARLNASRAKETKKRNTMAVNTGLNEDLYVGSKGKKGWKTENSVQRLKQSKKPIWGAPKKGGSGPFGFSINKGPGGYGWGSGTEVGNR